MATARVSKKNLRDDMSEHLTALRSYAERSVVRGEDLSPEELEDRDIRFQAYTKIGGSLKLTESEMVGLMFKGLFDKHARCGCYQCRTRNTR